MQAIPGPFNSIGRALQPGGAGDALSQQLAGVLNGFRPIGFCVNLARITQDAKAALLFSQLVYWTRYGADVEVNSGWVFKSRQEFELELGLTRAEQESARATLVRMGLLEEARVGSPARNCYRVMPEVLGTKLAELMRVTPVQWSLLDMRSDAEELKALLGRQFAFYRVFTKVTGSTTAAIYLAKALTVQRRMERKGKGSSAVQAGLDSLEVLAWDLDWFRLVVDQVQADTGLTPAQQREAKQRLCQAGILQEAEMTHPRRQMYLRVDVGGLCGLVLGVEASGGRTARFLSTQYDRTYLTVIAQFENNQADRTPAQVPDAKSGLLDEANCNNMGLRHDLCQKPALLQSNRSETGFATAQVPDAKSGLLDEANCNNMGLRHDLCQKTALLQSNRPETGFATAQVSDAKSGLLDGLISHPVRLDSAPQLAGFSTVRWLDFAPLHVRAGCLTTGVKTTTTTTTTPDCPSPEPPPLPSQNSPPGLVHPPPSLDGALPLSGAVVVVSSGFPEIETGKLVWPEKLSANERERCARILSPLAKSDQLDILDEFAGHLDSGKVKSPVAYLSRLVRLHLSTPGGLVFERVDEVREQRRIREQVAAVVRRNAVQPTARMPYAGTETVTLSAAAKAAREKLRLKTEQWKKELE